MSNRNVRAGQGLGATQVARYVVRYRTPEGASRKRRFNRKADADRWLVEVEHSKNVGGYVDTAAGRTTLGAFAPRWLAAQTFDESTREAVALRLRVHLEPAFGKVELRAIRAVALAVAERLRRHPSGEERLVFTSREHKPTCYSVPGSRFGYWRTTSATPTRASRYGCTRTHAGQ